MPLPDSYSGFYWEAVICSGEVISRPFVGENRFLSVLQNRMSTKNTMGCLFFIHQQLLCCFLHTHSFRSSDFNKYFSMQPKASLVQVQLKAIGKCWRPLEILGSVERGFRRQNGLRRKSTTSAPPWRRFSFTLTLIEIQKNSERNLKHWRKSTNILRFLKTERVESRRKSTTSVPPWRRFYFEQK